MKYLEAKKEKEKFLGFPSSFLCIVIIREIAVKKVGKIRFDEIYHPFG